MTSLHNITRKAWHAGAKNLDELIERLIGIRDKLDGRSCKVIGVSSRRELQIIGVQTRSDLLEHELGKHLNALASEATEEEIAESIADVEHQLVQGEVVYIVLDEPSEPAAPEVYER